MSSPTDIESVKLLLAEVNTLGRLVIGNDGGESARKKLISAAEKLIIAARTPGENLYLTAAQVGILSICQGFLYSDGYAAFSQWIHQCCLLHWMLRLHPQ
jgi:hypothetical protein